MENQQNKMILELKIKDANSDIDKIDQVLAKGSLFNSKANQLYRELNKKINYAPYVAKIIIKKRMAGNTPFEKLSYFQKREVLVAIKEAIEIYIAIELTVNMTEGKKIK